MADTTSASAPVAGRQASPPPVLLSIVVWSIPAIFYVFAFFLRSSPAVMTAELMRSFSIGAKDLGSLSAFYFYAYVLMQIATGMLMAMRGGLLSLNRIQTRLERFISRVIARRAASIWRAVTRSGSSAFRP